MGDRHQPSTGPYGPLVAEQARRRADLVLEGGGVKGVALVGAVTRLAEQGYAFPRVAGSSAGAVTAAVVAALQRAGEPVSRLREIADGIDYRKIPDSWLPGPLALLGQGLGLLTRQGLHPGRYLRDHLAGVLADLGVRTFGDLRIGGPAGLPADPGSALPPAHRYGLVVTASDLSEHRLLRLPWDYRLLGVDPDEQLVVDAVQASAAIPYFFQPARLAGRVLVDGGLLSNFPVALFDREDGLAPRWPTFGIKLAARAGATPTAHAAGDPLSFTVAVVETLVNAQDAAYVDGLCVQLRTTFVDTSDTSTIDFGISAERRAVLGQRGASAAQDFLDHWDEDAYRRRCRGA